MYGTQISEFRQKLLELSSEDLLEIIEQQNPELVMHVKRIEWVFANKLRHLNWPDGRIIDGRPVTREELSLLIDQPFEPDKDLTASGMSAEQQYQIHIAADPVLWARHVLKAKPRAYQVLMLRHPSLRKVLRAGRRLGKTFTMAIKILHYAYTHNHGRVLVIAPMKSHVELIFKEVMRLADQSGIVKDSITRSPTSPQFVIEFANGSTIRFFTSGMRSGGKADVARGQEAHLIVLDELDYMAPEDLDAVYVMLQKTNEDQADKELIGASTPTGLRERFWAWCNNPRFKEFWFPSYCNPNFERETEQEFREEYSEMTYRHEVEADWGESAEGVYPRLGVDLAYSSGRVLVPEGTDMHEIRALSDWNYSFERAMPGSVVVLGVDWDKYGAGVNIVALEICPPDCADERFNSKIRVMFREEMKKDEFGYTKAVRRIIELNAVLNPKWIYVDRGSGETQVELLHQYGIDHPESGLRKKVKGIAFQGNIEVRDPATKQFEKKELKSFMVEGVRMSMEREQLIIPSSDDELYLQLISYIVSRTTITGKPVFEMAGNVPDHAHDALILAMHAIVENYDELLKIKVAKNAMFAVSNAGMTGIPAQDEDPRLRDKSKSNRIRRPMSASVRMGRDTIRRRSF